MGEGKVSTPKEDDVNIGKDAPGQGELHKSEEDVAELFMSEAEDDVDASGQVSNQATEDGWAETRRGSKRRTEVAADGDDSDGEKFGRFGRSRTVSMGTDEPTPEEIDEAMAMVDSMNIVDRKIVASAILGVDITEIYSPERVAKVARRYGLTAGSSMDLTNGWDFTNENHKRMA